MRTVPPLHTIKAVTETSPAFRAGIRAGFVLCKINGHTIADCIDYSYYTAEPVITLELLTKKGRKVQKKIKNHNNKALGLIFETDLMDAPRVCANHCVFCFVRQQPSGLRENLMLRDDDWRLSFLTGTYITLTNLTSNDWRRILELKPSPLYISVHATDHAVRQKMLGRALEISILDQLHELAAADIRMHCQVVVCPEYNGGAVLEKTIKDLSLLRPWVMSLAVVPVGLTAHREGLPALMPVDHKKAKEIIALVNKYDFVHAADEFYMLANQEIPDIEIYGEDPQFEDGVGLTAAMRAEFLEELRAWIPSADGMTRSGGVGKGCGQTLATGMLAAPIIRQWLAALPPQIAEKTTVIPIPNLTMGASITVAGLITGKDLIAELKNRNLGQRLLIPAAMLRDGHDLTLDGMTLAQIQTALNCPVVPVSNDGVKLARALMGADVV
ncbi:MAG: DUF512 domain-containing protein [Clostridia bacterium]|nr:DUF512 domain-containing protein [Clostridia bacterium]